MKCQNILHDLCEMFTWNFELHTFMGNLKSVLGWHNSLFVEAISFRFQVSGCWTWNL